ncbi:nitrite/sulfite reductase [Fodinicola acaciae]|uniref:nitrite/sulfite reductase n=1 Tax=Fodinicola acaciae TaxID=2681555 RepID=UPI001FEB5F54|nr:nitrite/sulfite reductase [Fodinicola acaciae]
MTTSVQREAADRCPGALRVHPAADGGLARVRLPGGALTAAQLAILRTASQELGDGTLELTSRANIQIRALPAGAEIDLAHRLAAAGLLPSATHERIRNIIASPLSGRSGGLLDVHPLVAAIDSALVDTPSLAALPGRFLVVVDDGRGDVIGLAGDIGLIATKSAGFALVLAGQDTGIRVPAGDAAATVRATAEAFLAERVAQESTAWRLAELTDGPANVARRLALRAGGEISAYASAKPTTVGRDPLVVGVPLGRLTANQAAAMTVDVRITPWRSIFVPGGDAEALLAAGLIVDPDSAWIGVTSCAGRPRCASALADVRADAALSVSHLTSGRPVHWSGCGRRCGRPAGDAIDIVATPDGYQVDGRLTASPVQVVRGLR